MKTTQENKAKGYTFTNSTTEESITVPSFRMFELLNHALHDRKLTVKGIQRVEYAKNTFGMVATLSNGEEMFCNDCD